MSPRQDTSESPQLRPVTWLLRLGWLVGAVLMLPLVAAHLGPLRTSVTSEGLDPSWMAALADAAARGAAFGRDIVFTGGPLSALYTGFFEPAMAWPIAGFGLVVTAALTLVTGYLIAQRGWPAALALVVVLGTGVLLRDTIALLPALFLVLILTGEPRPGPMVRLAAVTAAAVLALAKFSTVPLLVLACLLADLLALWRRQWPWHSLAAIGLIALAFSLAGQDPLGLGDWLRGSLETSAGYSAAMSLAGRPLELAAWAGLTGILAAIVLRLALSDWRRGDRGVLAIAAEVVILAGFLFLALKMGFVRHDLHSLIGWGCLAVAAALVGTSPAARRDRPAAGAALAIALLALLPGPALLQRTLLPDYTAQPLATARAARETGETVLRFIADPGAWKRDAEARLVAARAALRASHPLPAIEGTIDVVPSNQALLIAHGLAYRPRPTVQEYTSYAPGLIARNRAHLEGPDGPANLLMQPGSIDGRHPASAEGALWPLILSRYEAGDIVGGMVLMRRRAPPVPLPAGAPVTIEAGLDTDVPLPAGDGPLVMTVRMPLTPLGRIMDIAFRPPLVLLTTVQADGSRTPWRAIPGMLSEGMVITPHVATAEDFRDLALGRTDRAGWTRPTAIRLSSGWLGRLAYGGSVTVTFTPLDLAPLAASR